MGCSARPLSTKSDAGRVDAVLVRRRRHDHVYFGQRSEGPSETGSQRCEKVSFVPSSNQIADHADVLIRSLGGETVITADAITIRGSSPIPTGGGLSSPLESSGGQG